MTMAGKTRSTWRKTWPIATLSTTNPTWTTPGSNPGLRGDRPATNRLSHATAAFRHYILNKTSKRACSLPTFLLK
jgi:hypothetical protein